VYLSHHLLAYVWMLERDRSAHATSPRDQTARCRSAPAPRPASTSTTDRAAVAAELGFERVAPNSVDAVSNRDFVPGLPRRRPATCATHLSRLAPSSSCGPSQEFGFVELPDAWTSGSSIMPQKKNPDAAELLRAKAPRIVGAPERAARRAATRCR
jgi:argininosuccinate lyase